MESRETNLLDYCKRINENIYNYVTNSPRNTVLENYRDQLKMCQQFVFLYYLFFDILLRQRSSIMYMNNWQKLSKNYNYIFSTFKQWYIFTDENYLIWIITFITLRKKKFWRKKNNKCINIFCLRFYLYLQNGVLQKIL